MGKGSGSLSGGKRFAFLRVNPSTVRQRAFTLVELLIVIGIIAVLIGILLPAMSRVRVYSRFVQCKSNIRSQLQAHLAYAVDYKGCKPPLWRRGVTSIKYDFVSPDIKWNSTPVGQGILVERKYLTLDVLLDPSEAMENDILRDREAWQSQSNSGSSYCYFWRKPNDPLNPPELIRNVTYAKENGKGKGALILELNAEEGHNYTGEYINRSWVSHPGSRKMNVGMVDGSVKDYPIGEVQLKHPAQMFEELQWVDVANGAR